MKTIAVVEDNPDNRLLVKAILEDQYKIVEYENGIEALEGLKRGIRTYPTRRWEERGGGGGSERTFHFESVP